jgi:hypothetical protein
VTLKGGKVKFKSNGFYFSWMTKLTLRN